MFIPHIPVPELIYLLMKIRNNRPFMRISRIFILALVALSAIGCAGEWIKAWDASSPPCILGKWECYQGPPLFLSEFVFQLGASEALFLLPVIDLFAAVVLLFKPRRMYLALLLLSSTSIIISMSSEATPYMYYMTGSGHWLHFFAMVLILILAFPLSLDEQMKLYPNWNYQKYLPPWLAD